MSGLLNRTALDANPESHNESLDQVRIQSPIAGSAVTLRLEITTRIHNRVTDTRRDFKSRDIFGNDCDAIPDSPRVRAGLQQDLVTKHSPETNLITDHFLVADPLRTGGFTS